MLKIATVVALAALVGACAPSPPPVPSGRAYALGITSRSPDYNMGPAQCTEWLPSTKDASIVDVFNRVKQAVKPKGEYETTADFNSRVGEALSRIEQGLAARSGVDQLVVTHPVNSYWGKYDPDTQTFRVGVHAIWDTLFGYNNFIIPNSAAVIAPDIDYMPISESESRVGGYVGTNAFGATRSVTQYAGSEYGVALTEAVRGKGWTKQPKGVTFSLSPERAQEMKGAVGIKVIGKLVPPGWLEGYRSDSPTMNIPVDRKTTVRYVAITTTCAAVVDRKTGDVLKRLK